MAARSLGTLTLDLIAKVGGFVQGMDKAERSSQKWRKQVEQDAQAIGKAVGAATLAGSAALVAMTVSTVQSAAEITNLAGVANTSTTEFQRYSAAAKAVGIEQDKLADILKDVNDKVGDFLNTGGGEMADFFEKIAPKVGVTADNFRNLSGPQALGLYVSSLEKAKVSQADMTFYLEAIANDATLLLPLLRNNSEGFKVLGDAAESAGAIMDEQTIKKANELKAAVWLMEQSTTGLKNQLTGELLPALSELAGSLFEVTKEGTSMVAVGGFVVDTLKWMSKGAVGAVAAFDMMGKSIGGAAAAAGGIFEGLSWSDLLNTAGAGKTIGENLVNNWGSIKETAGVAVDDLGATAQKYAEILDKITNAGSGDTNNSVKQLAVMLDNLQSRTSKGGTFKAPTKDQVASAQKLAQTFKGLEEGYERQIALINTEVDKRKDATEVAKLQFEIESGKLVGINAQQQKRLESLAAELDQLKKLKLANEDAAKARAFADTLGQANQTARDGFATELAGRGMGDKARDRLQQDLEIQRDFNQQMADLQKQQNAGQIDQALYETQTGLLKEALAERMVIQQDYYNQLDAAESDWLAGVGDAWSNYLDEARDVSGQTRDMFASAFGGAEDSLVDFITTGKASFSDLAQSILKDLARIAIRKALVSAVDSAASTSWGSAIGSFFQAKGGAWSGGVQMFAKGGTFTNSVVSSPTAFGMAGGVGVMGEAGPEAIMPLTRAADGSLGVRAVGGGGGGTMVQISAPVSVVVQDRGAEGMEIDQGALAANLQTQMKAAAERAVAESWRPGGTSWRNVNGRG
ncbi:phage tail tape measure protein [Pseudomonas sp. 1D4]|uniref:phage tail tape measure protein n=1 Tax=Pseudomonadaceae TaxID=135621 RepID=UPI00084ACD31|nr:MULTISPECIES: phage tail tape measure protein [Pseudomonas]OEC42514.1 phage tail tape measure protein [Pseudomonas sp. 1D4]